MKFAKQKILKPNVLIVAMIVLALAGYIILGVFYMGEESDQDDITSQIEERSPVLAELEANYMTEDEEKVALAAAQNVLDEKQKLIPVGLDSNTVMQKILQYAEENRVQLPGLSIPPETVQEADGIEYYMVSFSMSITGAFANVMDFISTLENNEEIGTLQVSDVSMRESGGQWSATFSVSLASLVPDEEPSEEDA